MSTDYVLTMSDVSARRLRHVSLALLPGEIAGVVGAQGAGKSTLLHVAAGRIRPRSGEVRACGLVGLAPEVPVFPPVLTVRQVLDYYARLNASAARRSHMVRHALDMSGLGIAADQRAETLDKVDTQRLSLAQAALGGRRVLVLDEMLCGLDAFARRDIAGRIAALAAAGMAVLISARDPAALERLAARVLVLRDGRIVRSGPLPALLGERVLEVVLDAPPREPPPGFRVTASGIETPLNGRTAEAALAVCRAHRLAVRATRVRVKSLEEVVLETHGPH